MHHSLERRRIYQAAGSEPTGVDSLKGLQSARLDRNAPAFTATSHAAKATRDSMVSASRIVHR